MSSWPNLADLMVARDAAAPVGLLGAPLAAGSVTPGACDQAPELLRQTLKRIGLYDVETGRELAVRVADRGDVELGGADHRASDRPDPRSSRGKRRSACADPAGRRQ